MQAAFLSVADFGDGGLTIIGVCRYLAAAIIAWICATASFVRNSK